MSMQSHQDSTGFVLALAFGGNASDIGFMVLGTGTPLDWSKVAPARRTTSRGAEAIANVPPSWRDRIVASQRTINWDGQGAQQIGTEATAAALAFVAEALKQDPSIPEPMFVGPTRSGEIAIQWDEPDWAVVVEIGTDASAYYRQCVMPDGTFAQGVVSTQTAIDELIACVH